MVGFVPIIVLGLLSFYSIKTFHASDVASIENNFIGQKTEEIEAFIDSIISTFKIKVSLVKVGSFNDVNKIEINSQLSLLKQLVDTYPDIQELSFIDIKNGFETSKINKSSPNGVAPTKLQDQSNSEKFTTAKTGQVYISPAYLTAAGPAITVAGPVYNSDNNVIISVVAGEVNLGNLQKIVERSQLGTSGYLYIVARDGYLLAHSQLDKLGTSGLSNIYFVRNVLNKNKDGQTNNRYQSIWGEQVVAAGNYMDNLQMGIIAEWPVKEADLVINILNNQFLIVSILVLAGTIFFSFILAGRIVKPIKTLETGTVYIAEGKFDLPINIKTGDEIEELGNAFNGMIAGLKRLEELKNEFVFIAAHDLRTPVTAIKGYLSLVLEGNYGLIEPEVKDVLVKITEVNQRLIQLVNDLLQVARAEAGRIPIKVSSMDAIKPIEEVLTELKPLADEKGIKLTYDLSVKPLPVLADHERFKELMVNLVGNAIKYTIGSGTVTISHDIQNKNLITKIKDTGMGISPEDQKRLFEKFYRIENDKTRNIQGTGLGLFIVKEIIEKMNGRIWVESEEGKGSIFSFSLPLAG